MSAQTSTIFSALQLTFFTGPGLSHFPTNVPSKSASMSPDAGGSGVGGKRKRESAAARGAFISPEHRPTLIGLRSARIGHVRDSRAGAYVCLHLRRSLGAHITFVGAR